MKTGNITLCADVHFNIKIPFLASVTINICFGTAEVSIADTLLAIPFAIAVYVYDVPDFESLREALASENFCNEDERVPELERHDQGACPMSPLAN